MGRYTESVNGIVIGDINPCRGKLFSKRTGKPFSENLLAKSERELKKAAIDLIAERKKEFFESGEPKYTQYYESLWKEWYGEGFELRIYDN